MAAAARPTRKLAGPIRLRTAGLQALLVLWACLVIARLFWLQMLDHAWLEQRAVHQQTESVVVSAQRGGIYDRNLTPLAMSLPVQSLFALPRQVPDPEATAEALGQALRLDAGELRKTLTSRRSFVWIARQVTASQAEAVDALHLQGIYEQPDTRRFYPKGSLAANVLGYVGLDGSGLGGLEHSFNSVIGGRNGEAVLDVDAHRQSYRQYERQPAEGANLVLTLDQNIQFIAQQELDRQVAATHAERGVVVIENPHTGEILALANSPTFNPDDYQAVGASLRSDAAVSDPYEPGSIFKLVTISAALDRGLVTPDEMFDCQMGSIKLGGRIIHDHARFGMLSVTDILRHSSDVGAIKIGLKLGDQEFYRYIRAYGFGQPTGIRLPGESRGIVRPPSAWTPMSIGAVSMGQEVAVTPVQVVAMVSTLANGGVYRAPRLVLDTFTGPTPNAPPAYTPDPGRAIVSPLVANEMKQMMAQVVLAGTAQQAQLNGYTAGGKTGTAQKVDPGTHQYSANHYVASFAGFAPLNDPAVTILVVIDSPQGGHEGGATAGPVFKAIAERVLPYLGVPHDIPVQAPPIQAPAVRVASAAAVPARTPAVAAVAEVAPTNNNLVVVSYGAPAPTVPDFTGQTLRQVSDACQRLGIALSVEGSGVARSQSLPARAPLPRNARLVVSFTP